MKDSNGTIGWIIIVLLGIATIIANKLMMPPIGEPGVEPGGGPFVITIFMILIAICGLLAVRYKSTD